MTVGNMTIDELVDAIAEVQARLDAQKQVVDELRQELVDRLTEDGVSATTTTSGHKVAVVRGQTTQWDLDVLKDVLIPLDLWERVRVLTETVDEQALERLIDQGDVSPAALQPAMTVRDKKPYPKITHNRRNDR